RHKKRKSQSRHGKRAWHAQIAESEIEEVGRQNAGRKRRNRQHQRLAHNDVVPRPSSIVSGQRGNGGPNEASGALETNYIKCELADFHLDSRQRLAHTEENLIPEAILKRIFNFRRYFSSNPNFAG